MKTETKFEATYNINNFLFCILRDNFYRYIAHTKKEPVGTSYCVETGNAGAILIDSVITRLGNKLSDDDGTISPLYFMEIFEKIKTKSRSENWEQNRPIAFIGDFKFIINQRFDNLNTSTRLINGYPEKSYCFAFFAVLINGNKKELFLLNPTN